MIRSGLCSVTFRAVTPEEIVDLAAQTGVEAIEWGADKHVPPADTENARHIGDICRARGIVPASYGSYVRAGTPEALQSFGPVLDAAKALGATNVRVWAGEAKRAIAGETAFSLAVKELHEMARMAADHGVTVSVEYHRKSLTEEAEDTLALLKQADHENLFSYWQPVPGRGRARWLEELAMLSPYLGDLHIFYWIMTGAGQERRPLKAGLDDWRALIDNWRPAPHWPHPQTGFLEFVRDDSKKQFCDDMQQLVALCRQPATARKKHLKGGDQNE